MRLRKNAILTMVLGLMLFVSAAGMAQTTTQVEQKKSETCCSMDSCCCCNGESCDMKMKHDAKNHSSKCCNMKHKEAKNKVKQKSVT